MDLTKFKWKCRVLLLSTTCYRDSNYKKSKELYQKHIKEFHKRHVKLISFRKKGLKFSIKLIGYDGTLKKEYLTLEPHNIFDLIDSMPMSKENYGGKLKPLNLSLYSDYKPETTLKGLGFKNKEKATYTIDAIKDRQKKSGKCCIHHIMQSKKHANKTSDMDEAIFVFEKWMIDYKKGKFSV